MTHTTTAKSVRQYLSRESVASLLLILVIPFLCAFTHVTPEFYIDAAQEHIAKGKPAAAYACLERAIALAPDHPGAYISRAFISLKRGDRQRAIDDFSRAIELRPKDGSMYLSRGFAYAEEGDTEKAQADYRRACDIDGSGCSFLSPTP